MYLALLAQRGQDISWVRLTGLSCNAVVTAQGSLNFYKKSWLALRPVIMLLLFSVPPCIAGAFIEMKEEHYFIILAVCLFLAGIFMLFQPQKSLDIKEPRNSILLFPASMVIGFVSGITGIGGGVYLSPLLHLTGWGSAKHIAGASSLFILVNSIAGLVIHWIKGSASLNASSLILIVCVLVGGNIGSRFGSSWFSQKLVRNITAAIILFASLRILWKYV